MICLITCKSLTYQRFLVHILKIQAVSINHRKLKVLEKVLEKEQKNKAIYYEMALYQWQGQKDLVSPAGSVGASALRAEVSTGDPHPLQGRQKGLFNSGVLEKRELFGERRKEWSVYYKFYKIYSNTEFLSTRRALATLSTV